MSEHWTPKLFHNNNFTKNRSVSSNFWPRESLFIHLLIVSEKFDMGLEPPAQFPMKQHLQTTAKCRQFKCWMKKIVFRSKKLH